ncbi:putative tetratricopeptide-like helical domain superfamily [Helianthus annuus]|nr:putative tetratricopeptide-like helical domain superfamily [Helianthus annuus]KAJ0775914.1 putative tetratricopeptide-like helical domain superfamily [Helianthus annuus]
MTKARSIFDLLTSKGLVPDVVAFNSLVNGYCKSLKIEEAMLMFHEITRKGLKPGIITYSTMLQGLFRVGRCGETSPQNPTIWAEFC